MDKGKGVRKYGRMRQGVRWGKYQAHKTLLVLYVLLVMLVPFFGVFLALYYLTAPIIWRLPHIIGNALIFNFTFLLIIFAEASIGGLVSVLAFKLCFPNIEDNPIFHPKAPTDDPLLPDEELLVRASSASAAQPAELLRAAQETKEEKPEELLRAHHNDAANTSFGADMPARRIHCTNRRFFLAAVTACILVGVTIVRARRDNRLSSFIPPPLPESQTAKTPSLSPPKIPQTPAEPITEITLQREPGMSLHPTAWYSLTLRNDGTATYIGAAFTARKGTFQAHIAQADFNRLAERIGKSGFLRYKPFYGLMDVTDICEDTLSIVCKGQRKTVMEHGESYRMRSYLSYRAIAAPKELGDIKGAMDALVAHAHWVKRSAKTDYPQYLPD